MRAIGRRLAALEAAQRTATALRRHVMMDHFRELLNNEYPISAETFELNVGRVFKVYGNPSVFMATVRPEARRLWEHEFSEWSEGRYAGIAETLPCERHSYTVRYAAEPETPCVQ